MKADYLKVIFILVSGRKLVYDRSWKFEMPVNMLQIGMYVHTYIRIHLHTHTHTHIYII